MNHAIEIADYALILPLKERVKTVSLPLKFSCNRAYDVGILRAIEEILLIIVILKHDLSVLIIIESRIKSSLIFIAIKIFQLKKLRFILRFIILIA